MFPNFPLLLSDLILALFAVFAVFAFPYTFILADYGSEKLKKI
jgi:hypothetical protein